MNIIDIKSLATLAIVVLTIVACSNPADDKTEAVVEDAKQPVATTEAPAGDAYVLAEGSTVEFTGSKITGSHDGGFRAFDGVIHLVDGDPVGSRVEIVIDTTSLWADEEKLTGHLKSPDFFDVETFPTATFTSTDIASTADGYTVTGNLDLHGITKSISFPAAISVEEGRIHAEAEFFVKRFDFDIVYPGKPDDLIRDEVVIRLNLEALPQEG